MKDFMRRGHLRVMAVMAVLSVVAGTNPALAENQSSGSGGFSYGAYASQTSASQSPGTSQTAGARSATEGRVGISFDVASQGPLPSEAPYTLGRGDMIRVIVRGQPDFSGDYVIGPDGHIQFSYLGDVPAAGKTKDELSAEITKLLETYVRVPEVSISITGYNSKAIYILGGVGGPGKYFLTGDTIKLRDAIFAAGLPTREGSYRRVYVITPTEEGEPEVQKVNLYQVLYKGRLEDNIDLHSGQVVFVPTTVLSELSHVLQTIMSPVYQGASAADVAQGDFD